MKPSFVALDFETALLDNSPSLEYWRDDFRVVSTAIAWFHNDEIKTFYCKGEEATRELLLTLDIPIVVHNISFDAAVAMYRFPDIKLNICYDTIRLAQLADGGGKESFKKPQSIDNMLSEADDEDEVDNSGLKLDKVAARWLGSEFHNHKEEAYSWLRENGIKKSKEGGNLHLLPEDIAERYNVADAAITLKLYKKFCEYFESIKYDWRFDHSLYIQKCLAIGKAKGEGIRVDRPKLQAYYELMNKKISDQEALIRQEFLKEIEEIEAATLDAMVNSIKTESRKPAKRQAIIDSGTHLFKVSSNTHKKVLLIDKLGMETPFTTPTGQPSFKKAHLNVFGKFGELAESLGTMKLVRNQCKSLLLLSERDGRFHVSLRAASTKTGRNAGGEGNG